MAKILARTCQEDTMMQEVSCLASLVVLCMLYIPSGCVSAAGRCTAGRADAPLLLVPTLPLSRARLLEPFQVDPDASP